MFAELKTERLTMGALKGSDQAAVVEILMDETVGKTYMVPDPMSKEIAARIFNRLWDLAQSEDHYVVGIYLDESLIGWINDTEIRDGVIEVGYVIHPRYHGCGYMTEALQAAIRDLFKRGYNEIVAGAFEENKASIRVMEKCGLMRLDRQDEIEYRGQSHRCVYYLIVKES